MKTNSNPAPSPEQVLFLIRRIISEITFRPESTKVTMEKLGMRTVGINIDPFPGDYGRILGRNRDALNGLKMICKLISDRTGVNYELAMRRLPEGSSNDSEPLPEFVPSDKWRKDDILALTQDLFGMILPGPSSVNIFDGSHGKTAIDVVIGDDTAPGTVTWISGVLPHLYKAMGLMNKRVITLSIIQDAEMLRKLMSGASAMV